MLDNGNYGPLIKLPHIGPHIGPGSCKIVKILIYLTGPCVGLENLLYFNKKRKLKAVSNVRLNSNCLYRWN